MNNILLTIYSVLVVSLFIYTCSMKPQYPEKRVNCKVLKGYQGVRTESHNQSTIYMLILSDPKNRIFSLDVTSTAYYKGLTQKNLTFLLSETQIDKELNDPNCVYVAICIIGCIIWLIWFGYTKIK